MEMFVHLIWSNLIDWDALLSTWHVSELHHDYFFQPFSWGDQGGKRVMLSRVPCNATVMSCHRSCGWFPSDSRGTATVRLSVLIGAAMRWGKCLNLTLSPPFSDLVEVGTD